MIKTTLNIEGMMCPKCEEHTDNAISKAFVVSKVTSSHAKNETVVISENVLDEGKLHEVIEELGYELKGIKSEPYEKKGIFSFFKK